MKSKLNNNYYDEDELDKIATDDENNEYEECTENNDNDNSFNSVLDDMRENLNNQKARVQYLYCKNARQSNIISDMIRNNRSILLRNDRLNFQNRMLQNNNSILQNDLQRSVIKQEEQKLEIERLKG